MIGTDARRMRVLIDELQKRLPTAKRQTLRRMLAAGRVQVNGRTARQAKMQLNDEDQVTVLDQAPQTADKAAAGRPAGKKPARARAKGPSTAATGDGIEAPLQVVYEDADVLVVNKPAGLLTSTTPREPRPTLLKLVRDYVGRSSPRAQVGLIHRLDREASGLLVFSKNPPAYDSLKTQFFKHTVDREYLAIVHGTPEPPEGRIENHLTELTTGKVVRTRIRGKGQKAVTDYRVIETRGKRSLVRVTLQTGRKHQIRAHLSQRGWPIVGDAMYGPATAEEQGLHLCAVRLAFDHPRTGERCVFEIEPPFALEPPPANR